MLNNFIFWIVEPWAFMRMSRMLKVVKLILKIYQAIKKGQQIKQKIKKINECFTIKCKCFLRNR